MKNAQSIKRVLKVAFSVNIFVAVAKITYGLITHTLSMVADGIHSLTDAGSSVMGFISVRYASKPSDEGHHYGHQKYETLAALGIAGLIALTSWEVLRKAVQRLFDPSLADFHVSGVGIMIFSMAVNLLLARYEKQKSQEFKSHVLEADAYHTASDFWISLSVLISLFAIRYGVPWVDPLVSLLIAIYFGYVAFKLVRETGLILTDAAFIDVKEVEKLVRTVTGVISCHKVRTRGRPGHAFVDLHIQIDPTTDTAASHTIVHNVEKSIKKEIDGVHEVLIHTEPYPDDQTIP